VANRDNHYEAAFEEYLRQRLNLPRPSEAMPRVTPSGGLVDRKTGKRYSCTDETWR
jgi:hypothetical protein